jgi:hypothetical protein
MCCLDSEVRPLAARREQIYLSFFFQISVREYQIRGSQTKILLFTSLLLCIYDLINDDISTSHYKERRLVNNKWVRMWKESIVA